MTEENSSYGSAKDWAQIISAAGEGASSGLQSAGINANSRREAREAKRRTMANLLSNALKRKQGLFRAGQEHSDDMNDIQSQAMQQTAKGFVNALQGYTGS